MKRQLHISIDGKAIDLNPSAAMELEEQNLYLQLSDELTGDYSMPIEVPLTDRNLPIFKHVNLLQAENKTSTYDRTVVSDGLEQMYGMLRKEQLNGNLNFAGNDKLSLYFLKGWSHFFKDVEKKTLFDVDYGGERSFAYEFELGNIYQSTFWKHIYSVMRTGTIDTFDYAVYTTFNTGITSEFDYEKTANIAMASITNGQPPVMAADARVRLYPYLNYLIKRIFATFGWTVEGYIFNDPGFKKATLIQTQPLEWWIHPGGQVRFDLKNFLPLIQISTFLIELKNRFGWKYDFDTISKKCVIRKMTDLFNGTVRTDITASVETAFNLKISTQKKSYALVSSNNPDSPKISSWNYKGGLLKASQLPVASAAAAGQVYFISTENKYYMCSPVVIGGTTYEWAVLTENDFSYVPTDKTDEIRTNCLIPATRYIDYRQEGANQSPIGKILVPEFSLPEDNTETEIFYVCFSHGLHACTPNNPANTFTYPYGSPHNYDLAGNRLGDWAMNYRFLEPSGSEVGLYALSWEPFLKRLGQEEVMEIIANLTHRAVMLLKWEDSVLIRNVEYIVIGRSRTIPYNDQIKLTLTRV